MIEPAIYDKLARYCAYQERAASDVRNKLFQLKVEKEEFDAYIEKLKADNYLNEDRFAKAFVNGHVKKKWGKVKIKAALGQKKIPAAVIQKYLSAVEDGDYAEKLAKLAERKLKTIKAETRQERTRKLMMFLRSKGYEADKIATVLKALKI